MFELDELLLQKFNDIRNSNQRTDIRQQNELL